MTTKFRRDKGLVVGPLVKGLICGFPDITDMVTGEEATGVDVKIRFGFHYRVDVNTRYWINQ